MIGDDEDTIEGKVIGTAGSETAAVVKGIFLGSGNGGALGKSKSNKDFIGPMDDAGGALPVIADADDAFVDLDFEGDFIRAGSNLGGGGRKVDGLLLPPLAVLAVPVLFEVISYLLLLLGLLIAVM